MQISKSLGALALVLIASACSKGGLHDLRNNSSGPDEFLVQPVKPLENPANFAELPQPTPGGINRTDQNPRADAIVALGGNPGSSGVPASDSALLAATGRYGVQPDIREDLAEEDAKFRRREQRTARIKLFPVDRYGDAYKRQSLDPFAVNQAYRNAQTGTPSAPPAQ
ncbi:DUF3035 domain-containing protein [Epibacterium sp. SM1979]|uniref:DUF3035 domain-containing protein n=1 Tax=Tritonibacter litoralis TaxID=2662264 RepID=A0A843YAV3_9RHOB|nr:DUF3035 domain-containing protein [Tritonibacter litoralis]MQQ08086.1 DUF3035 domain-containing protein [Tritonibacter litoralis]